MAGCELLENAFAGDGFGSLFHAPDFFRMHEAGAGRYFEWVNGRAVRACVHFTPANGDGLWRSPARGTYAGYAFDPALPTADLFAFHAAVERRLAALEARQVELLPAPMAHDPRAFATEVYLLRASGYDTSQCDLNHSLEVGAAPLVERMAHNNAKRLRKCHREGLRGVQLPATCLPAVYDVLDANRTHRGRHLSMTLDQLGAMVAAFPDAVMLFGVPDGDRLAASALCLRVHPRTVYVYAWGDRPGYEAFSPVVAVADAIHAHCQALGVAMLDVGTSTVDHDANHGLIHFKRGLGCTESLKVRVRRTLAVATA